MKKLFLLPLLFAGYAMLTASSCNHDDDKSVTPGNPLNSTPGSGWKLSLFTEPGENKTSDYNGYTFGFAQDGTMTAARSGQNTSGTWRQYQNNGVTKFEITLSTSDHDLSELNDDWILVSKTDALISLKDDNAARNEQLQFSK